MSLVNVDDRREHMPRHTQRLREIARLLAVLTMITLALGAGSGAVSADVLNPRVDTGGPGGGSGSSSMMIEQAGLVPTNGGPDSFSMNDTPVLVGSTEEREEVAREEGPVLVGSTAEREEVAQETAGPIASDGNLDEVSRSASLIALSPEAPQEYAEAPGQAAR